MDNSNAPKTINDILSALQDLELSDNSIVNKYGSISYVTNSLSFEITETDNNIKYSDELPLLPVTKKRNVYKTIKKLFDLSVACKSSMTIKSYDGIKNKATIACLVELSFDNSIMLSVKTLEDVSFNTLLRRLNVQNYESINTEKGTNTLEVLGL